MVISGLQKLTLLDYPGHTACTVFTPRCNWRCPFCHNAALVLRPQEQPPMDPEEFFSFLRKRKGLLDGVAVTGGEPTLYADLPDFLRRIKDMGFAVKLDTNGTHPAMLRAILEAGLADYVAMDIKAGRGNYSAVTGTLRPGLDAVEESVALLRQSGTAHEFRTTVVEEFHTAGDIEAVARWIAGAKRYFLQAFTDRDTVPFAGLHAPSDAQMRRYADIARRYVPDTRLRGVE